MQEGIYDIQGALKGKEFVGEKGAFRPHAIFAYLGSEKNTFTKKGPSDTGSKFMSIQVFCLGVVKGRGISIDMYSSFIIGNYFLHTPLHVLTQFHEGFCNKVTSVIDDFQFALAACINQLHFREETFFPDMVEPIFGITRCRCN